MDPVTVTTIASAAVTLLTPYLKRAGEEVAKSAGGAAWNKATQLYQAVKAKFSQSPEAKQQLDELSNSPDDSQAQAAVRTQLQEMVSSDTAFAQELASLLKEAAESGADRVFQTNIYGEVQKLTQIGHVSGDVNIN